MCGAVTGVEIDVFGDTGARRNGFVPERIDSCGGAPSLLHAQTTTIGALRAR